MSINMKAIRVLCTIFGCSVFSSSNVFANESVTVYAAASLTNAVNELDAIYEQKNKVEVIRLITKGTIEEKILELQMKKRILSDKLIDGEIRDQNMLNQLTEQDIKNLLSYENE